MLNRRFLRIKAMQALYAFRQKQESNFNLALDTIDDTFAPDLNSMDKPNIPRLESHKKEAKELFSEAYETKKITGEPVAAVKNAVNEAIVSYHNQLGEDKKRISQQMLEDTETIAHHYFCVLQLLLELRAYVERLANKHANRGDELFISSHYKIKDNFLLNALVESDEMTAQVNKRGIVWDKEDSLIAKIYKKEIKEDEEYQEYCKTAEHDFDTDRALVIHLLKKVFFKSETFESHFENLDPHWEENMLIVKSMCVKTCKMTQEKVPVVFLGLSENWDEDKEFFEKLYFETLKQEPFVDELVEDKLKNWEMDRVAMVDKIILEMAVTEMLNFPNIPVKVTINEFIELSKNYSTPKSKQFVNGILDVVSKQLQEEGKIKKSGRGLVDNK